jgi:hypothetical protein
MKGVQMSLEHRIDHQDIAMLVAVAALGVIVASAAFWIGFQ